MNPFDKEEYESLMETLEVLSDKKQVERLASALKHAQAGRLYSHADVFETIPNQET